MNKLAIVTLLDKQGIKYDKLLANENVELTQALSIKQAPTLVVVNDGKVEKYAGVSDIKKYLKA